LSPLPEPLVVDPGASASVLRRTRRGLLLMLAATAAFVGMSMCVKLLREAGLSTAEVIFFRTGPGLLWLWWTLRVRHQSLRPVRRDLVYLRSVLGIAAMATSFYAVQSLTLVQHNVLGLLQPVFIALLAPLLLAEPMRRIVVAALVLAGGGALLVLAPGADLGVVPLLPACFGVASALLSAGAHMVIRRSMATESAEVVVFHFAVHATVFGMLWGISQGDFFARVAEHVSGETLLPLLGLALLGVLGQLAMTRAYAHAPASLVAIVAYAGIPMSIAGDVLLWGAHPALASAVGVVLMIAAGFLLTRRSQPGHP
jgi:drug/metabolite transporter (DMT)-like permease